MPRCSSGRNGKRRARERNVFRAAAEKFAIKPSSGIKGGERERAGFCEKSRPNSSISRWRMLKPSGGMSAVNVACRQHRMLFNSAFITRKTTRRFAVAAGVRGSLKAAFRKPGGRMDGRPVVQNALRRPRACCPSSLRRPTARVNRDRVRSIAA